MGSHEHLTTDGRKVVLPLRGMAAIEAAARGADLYASTSDGMMLVSVDKRQWVIDRCKRMPTKVTLFQFAAPETTR